GKNSWFGFAKTIFYDDFSNNERKLKRLTPISTSEYPTPASRPAFSLLDNQKIADTFNLNIPEWDQILELVLSR
ncbi:MAG: dTDP-4-dehydrorhamnose reductase, partial [Nostocales cyanobacterium]